MLKDKHIEEIKQTIDKLENCENITHDICAKLANMYTVLTYHTLTESQDGAVVNNIRNGAKAGAKYEEKVKHKFVTEVEYEDKEEFPKTPENRSYFMNLVSMCGTAKALKGLDMYAEKLKSNAPVQYTKFINAIKEVM